MDGLLLALRIHAGHSSVRQGQVPGQGRSHLPRQGYHLRCRYRGWRLQGGEDWM